MIKGFVFGKFLPFHKGHEAMVNFALTKCDLLTILVCCSDKETISCETRTSWISRIYDKAENIEIKAFRYRESELPNSSESSIDISRIWSDKFRTLFPDNDVVVTSEPYGYHVAAFLGIKHIPFDIEKRSVPTSATAIREDLFKNWNYLPDVVKTHFAIKVVILGTESTGKTTLTHRLAEYFNCTAVDEAGRDMIPDSRSFEFDDLYAVATEHANRIDRAIMSHCPLVIIDTDIHITMSYANFIFNKDLEVSDSIYGSSKADLYLYMNKDAEYVQDGTRLNHRERDDLDLSHRAILKRYNINYVEIMGNWDARFEEAKTIIADLIKTTTKNRWT